MIILMKFSLDNGDGIAESLFQRLSLEQILLGLNIFIC